MTEPCSLLQVGEVQSRAKNAVQVSAVGCSVFVVQSSAV